MDSNLAELLGLLEKKSAQIQAPSKMIDQRIELMKVNIQKLDDPNHDLDSLALTTLDQSKKDAYFILRHDPGF